MIYTDIEQLIGNTPLLKISPETHGLKHIDVYAKLEYLNPFGSIKDRTALGLTGDIDLRKMGEEGTSLIESSSGNTSKALQCIAMRRGNNLICVTGRLKVPELGQTLKYLGVNLISMPGKSECPDPNDSDNAHVHIERMMSQKPGAYYHPNQYINRANPEVHLQTTAKEIFDDLKRVDWFVAGVGTGGSSQGLIEYIQNNHTSTKVVGAISDDSDFIPGIRTRNELFETKLFKREWFDALLEISSIDALDSLHDLVKGDAVLAGPTAGAGFTALKRHLKEHDVPREDGSRQVAVFIACDRLESYMSYISKRQPQYFGTTGVTDIFNMKVNDSERARYEKPASLKTSKWLEESDATIIDTRGVKPFQAFHIKGSLSYPEQLLHEVSEAGTPFATNAPVLFVCPRGDRSLLYASLFSKRGVEAYSLSGGLLAWRAAGLPLERQRRG